MFESQYSKIYHSKINVQQNNQINCSYQKPKILGNKLNQHSKYFSNHFSVKNSIIAHPNNSYFSGNKSVNQSRIFPLEGKSVIGKLQMMARHINQIENQLQLKNDHKKISLLQIPNVNIVSPKSQHLSRRSVTSSINGQEKKTLKVPSFLQKTIKSANVSQQENQKTKKTQSQLSEESFHIKSTNFQHFQQKTNGNNVNVKYSSNQNDSLKYHSLNEICEQPSSILNHKYRKLNTKNVRRSSLFFNNQKQFLTPTYKPVKNNSNSQNFELIRNNTDINSKNIDYLIEKSKQIKKMAGNQIHQIKQITQLKNQIPSFIKYKQKRNQQIQVKRQYAQKKWSIDDFQIKQKLGKGAFGDIFLVRQNITGFFCVLKKLSKKKIKQQKLQQQLLRQIKIQSFLKHRNITNLYGIFDDSNYVYLILQYLCDNCLSRKYNRKKCPETQVAMIMKQVCEGLKYMHIQQVIHRDIKLQNIFIFQNYIKIGDFGCAVRCDTSRNTVVGSLTYFSPEQLNHEAYNDKIDIWSLGILCYELLTGRAPFEQDILKIIKHQKQPKLSQLKFPSNLQISNEAKDFIGRLLQQNPENRLTITQTLKHSFILNIENPDGFAYQS